MKKSKQTEVKKEQTRVEKFRELFLKVDREDSEEFAAAMDAALSDGWLKSH